MYGVFNLVIIANLVGKEILLMNEQPSAHRTLILRCWSEEGEGAAQRFWRFHLHWLDTDKRQSFADVETLLALLADVFEPETDIDSVDG